MSISTISRQVRPIRDAAPAPTPTRDHLRAVPTPALPTTMTRTTATTPTTTTATTTTTTTTTSTSTTAFASPPRTVSADLGVPTLHRTVVDYANFDHAASTPALESVKAAVDIALRTYSSVHLSLIHI